MLSIKGEKFSKYCNVTKTQGRVQPAPPSPPLYHGRGISFMCVSQLNSDNTLIKNEQHHPFQRSSVLNWAWKRKISQFLTDP